MSQRKKHPPRFAAWILNHLISENLLEEFNGDLLEIYQDRYEAKGRFYALCMYWIDAMDLVVRFIRRRPSIQSNYSMLRHHIIISLRTLARNKSYTLINVFSLAIGIGVCLAITQYVYTEFHQDQDITQNPNIYRLVLERNSTGGLMDRDLYATHFLGTTADAEIPGITSFTRLYVPDEGAFISTTNQRPFSIMADEMYFVDENFLDFFELNLIAGDPKNALKELFNVVISEKIAIRHFGDSNPIGKVLHMGGGASHGDYLVTGVFRDRPQNSHLQFDYLFPLNNYLEYGWLGVVKRYPHVPSFATYFELTPSSNISEIESKLDEMIQTYKPEWSPELTQAQTASLQPIRDIHLDPYKYVNADYVTNKGNESHNRSFLLVGVLILVIAWFNYINLSTAQSVKRVKEVGIRKSMGAKRKQLMSQFLSEALIINVLAGVLAMGIGYFSLRLLSDLIGMQVSFTLLHGSLFWALYLACIIIGTLSSGFYPAFLLSKYKPVNLFARPVSKRTTINLRRLLVTFQFLVSLTLISGTYLVYRQIAFMQRQDLGMNMEKILVVNGPKHVEVLDGGPNLTTYEGLQEFKKYSRKVFTTFRSEMQKIPSVKSVAGSWSIPGIVYHTIENDIRRWGQPESENQSARMAEVGLDFFETYELELVAGHDFSAEHAGTRSVILNEKAVETFGFLSPEEAIGERLYFGKPIHIVGVVRNYHWQSLREDHSPWIIWFGTSSPEYISLKLNVADLQEVIPKVQQVYDSMYPGNPFEYYFIDDQFNMQYQADLQFGRLFLILTLLAIIVACIGLFALISYSATLKVKEIGLRKVLGASTIQLMYLLSREYLRLLSLATLISLPLIFVLSSAWLDNYAFRIALGIDIFVLPCFAMLLLAMLTVSHRTHAAAQANPVESLRSE